MKKTIIMAALGVAASVATSYGQGTVNFTSYFANSGNGANTFVFGGTTPVADGFHADLYFALGTSVTDPVNNNTASSITADPLGLTDLGVVGATYSGGFFGSPVIALTVPGYSSGLVTFEVVAFNGATYDTSTIRGRSGSFTQLIAPNGSPTPNLGNPANLPDFYVANVAATPEPTTLALAGLGGLASLVALRRKQA